MWHGHQNPAEWRILWIKEAPVLGTFHDRMLASFLVYFLGYLLLIDTPRLSHKNKSRQEGERLKGRNGSRLRGSSHK